MNSQLRFRPRTLRLKAQQGMTMLEVLIAVMILSVGLLGVAGLQTTNLRNSQSAHQRTMAVLLASGMAERIRANRVIARSGNYALARTCVELPPGGSLQQLEHFTWIKEIKKSLGTNVTCGEIVFDQGANTYTVIVFWDDSRALGGRANMAVRNLVSL